VLTHDFDVIKSNNVFKKEIRIYFPRNTKYNFGTCPKEKKYDETFILRSLVTHGAPERPEQNEK